MTRCTRESGTCPACIEACEDNPGWMTPDEAERAINAGLGGSLMRDWLDPCPPLGNRDRIYVLCPAAAGCAGDDGPEMPEVPFAWRWWTKGRCVMLASDNRCRLHGTGYKPLQCREALCGGRGYENEPGDPASNYDIAKLWNTDRGRALVARWLTLVERRREIDDDEEGRT